MEHNLKHPSQSFLDLRNLIHRSINVLQLDDTSIDIQDFNLKLDIFRKGAKIFTSLENYNEFVSKYITQSGDSLKIDEFQQDILFIDNQEVVCLTDLVEKQDIIIENNPDPDNTQNIGNESIKSNQFKPKNGNIQSQRKQKHEYTNEKENFINYKSPIAQGDNQKEINSLPELNTLDYENEALRSNKSTAFLDQKPFFNKHEEQEEWNVRMIDSIISKITQTDSPAVTYSPIATPKKRKKQSKSNELSIRPFVCEFKDCNSAFKRFEHLKRHNRIHTGERPFKCTFPGCYKKFARSDNLSQHTKIHNMKNRHFSEEQLPFYRNKF